MTFGMGAVGGPIVSQRSVLRRMRPTSTLGLPRPSSN